MASAWPKQSDCPSCQSLCLSPTILPCGHLLCRKCTRNILEDREHNPACPFCSHSISRAQGQTVSQLADQLGKDLILEDLVMEQLAGQGKILCLVCPNKHATKMCVDCGEMYCDGCSVGHKKMKVSKDHVQQDLPQALSNPSSSSSSTARPQRRHTLSSPDILSSSPSEDSIRYDHDTSPRHPQNTGQASLQVEARLLKHTASRLGQDIRMIRTNIVQLQEVERRLEGQQQLLETYTARLENADQALVASASALLPRLKRVCQDCRPPPEAALASLTRLVNRLMQSGTDTDGIHFDPMTSVPTRTFTFTPEAAGDTHTEGPWITSIVVTGDGRLVMADWRNKMVKVADVSPAATQAVNPLAHADTGNVYSTGGCMLKGVKLDTKPLKLALLSDGQVAVTGWGKRLYFVDVTGTKTFVSHVTTQRQYRGVGSLTDDDTLLAGCNQDTDGPSSVDVLTRAGVVMRTLADNSTLTALSWPHYLYVKDSTVWVSDRNADSVFAVDVDTRGVHRTFSHPDLKGPHQVAVDNANNCYIVSVNGRCVLAVTSGGQWRRLLNTLEHGEATRVFPMALCVTDWGVVVTWDGVKSDYSGPGSVVLGYKLT